MMGRVAQMHYEQGMTQSDVAAELHLSPARVSRLLKRASEEGLVRTIVTLPPNVHTDLELALEHRYGITEAIVADASGSEEAVLPALASSAAAYLEATLTGEPVVGIASWSSSLLAVMEVMQPTNGYRLNEVVQMVGGHGTPDLQMLSAQLIGRFARLTGAEAYMVPAPGLLGSTEAARSLMNDPAVRAIVDRWDAISVALVGIGAMSPSPLIRRSGNALPNEDLRDLEGLGAVGDVCLRYFDAEGRHVDSSVDERIVGIDPQSLLQIPRRIGVAGGTRKLAAIRAALLGGWVNILVTDLSVARGLLDLDG
jgi:DNA-binding transcriptional regulator LsrR (DeoR family)